MLASPSKNALFMKTPTYNFYYVLLALSKHNYKEPFLLLNLIVHIKNKIMYISPETCSSCKFASDVRRKNALFIYTFANDVLRECFAYT